MRRALPLSLAVLAGCVSAQARAQAPGRLSISPAEATSIVARDSTPPVVVLRGASCETNDPMPVLGRSLRAPAPPLPKQPGAGMPTLRTPGALSYIPNACPVTAGPLAVKSAPVVHLRAAKPVPEPQAQP